ncbi:MAG: acyl carrier protein [Clostridia bacterium]|nr:acyl carrier protein [Clostridia bacterium]
MDNFIELIKEVYDEDVELTKDSRFREVVEEFSSMMGFEIILTIEDEYDKRLSVDEFLACDTIEELYNMATGK